MRIYFRIDGLTIYEEYFAGNFRDFVIKVRDFFDYKLYGEQILGFLPIIVIRNQDYYRYIEKKPEEFKKYQYFPKVSFKRKEKTLLSFVEVQQENIRNAKTKSAVEKIVAKAILESIVNADKHAKQRIDFKQMEIDLLSYYALNGIAF